MLDIYDLDDMKLFGRLLVNRDCYPGDSDDDVVDEGVSVNSCPTDVRDAVVDCDIKYAEVLVGSVM